MRIESLPVLQQKGDKSQVHPLHRWKFVVTLCVIICHIIYVTIIYIYKSKV